MSPNELASLDDVVQRAGTTKSRVVIEEVEEAVQSSEPVKKTGTAEKTGPEVKTGSSEKPGKPVTAEGGKKKPDSLVSPLAARTPDVNVAAKQ